MNKLVSVVIPVYNSEKYIDDCILSVLNQTYQNVEIIVVDDKSTDSSAEIIKLYAKKESNIKTIFLSYNLGVGNARNEGLKFCNGDYILFLDSDDWLSSNYIEKMVYSMEFNNSDVAIANVIDYYTNQISANYRYNFCDSHTIDNHYAFKLLSRSIGNNFYITPMVGSKVIRKHLFKNKELKFLTNSSYEDDYFSFILFLNAKKISIVSEAKQYYRQRENSITHQFSKNRINELLDCFNTLKKILHNNSLFERYITEYNCFFERCIYTTYNSMIESKLTNLEKKKYISYFIEELLKNFSINEIINYIDIQRIEKFLGIK